MKVLPLKNNLARKIKIGFSEKRIGKITLPLPGKREQYPIEIGSPTYVMGEYHHGLFQIENFNPIFESTESEGIVVTKVNAYLKPLSTVVEIIERDIFSLIPEYKAAPYLDSLRNKVEELSKDQPAHIARVRIFSFVRDLPYRWVIGDQLWPGPFQLLDPKINCGTCLSKGFLLSDLLQANSQLGVEKVEFVSVPFRWSDLEFYPDYMYYIAAKFNWIVWHLALLIKIKGVEKWIPLDATFDQKLERILPIYDWDGINMPQLINEGQPLATIKYTYPYTVPMAQKIKEEENLEIHYHKIPYARESFFARSIPKDEEKKEIIKNFFLDLNRFFDEINI